ncbi:MAG: hypothetical protein Q9218_005209 [Villophora microphyllina]
MPAFRVTFIPNNPGFNLKTITPSLVNEMQLPDHPLTLSVHQHLQNQGTNVPYTITVINREYYDKHCISIYLSSVALRSIEIIWLLDVRTVKAKYALKLQCERLRGAQGYDDLPAIGPPRVVGQKDDVELDSAWDTWNRSISALCEKMCLTGMVKTQIHKRGALLEEEDNLRVLAGTTEEETTAALVRWKEEMEGLRVKAKAWERAMFGLPLGDKSARRWARIQEVQESRGG